MEYRNRYRNGQTTRGRGFDSELYGAAGFGVTVGQYAKRNKTIYYRQLFSTADLVDAVGVLTAQPDIDTGRRVRRIGGIIKLQRNGILKKLGRDAQRKSVGWFLTRAEKQAQQSNSDKRRFIAC